MKKLLLLSLISMAMFIPQIYSISFAEYIKQNGMPALTDGEDLDLSNKNLTDLEGLQKELQNIPKEVRDQILVLDLSRNQLQTLPMGIFNGLQNLQYLDLSYNQLQTLPMSIFNGLSNLASLSVHGNPFNGDFLLTLPAIIKSIPTLKYLDGRPVDEALKSKSYRVLQPKTLEESSAEKITKSYTPEQLERLAETNYVAFNLLPLSEEQKATILQRVAARLAKAGDPALDFLPLPAQQKAAIIAKNIDIYRNQLYKLSKEVLDLLPLTPQQRAGIEAQKRQMGLLS